MKSWARGTSTDHIQRERAVARLSGLFKGVDATPPKHIRDQVNATRRRAHDRDDREFLRLATASGYE
ncbi:hypothetical protein NH8B_0960 [Pseudogulbenkiania sp. NH8B]|uniref:hypothetical protein n=1 Tax=Pseudogulbenkiania sp. (strain NH8B) TaxID=748280 RepID=UPI0002279A7E|nr:hypothetical protein [Pseudogulbenkiania sp. NH8B]BAK75792.1 hypothetical protein NH8B_0960 [Pseudogulbenkiania sp. NH8B]